jgi:uncharacterized protein
MTKTMSFQASKSSCEVSANLLRPADARCLLVFAHGAGAGMGSGFMEAMAGELSGLGVATFRYNFPYMEKGKKVPDPQPILTATVVSAVEAAHEAAGDLPLFAGGKSLGGRMTSLAALPPLVKGLVFFGFPLHAPGMHSVLRAEHLPALDRPMLFLQGTRDAFANLGLLHTVIKQLGEKATLQVFEGADHSFRTLKSSGVTYEQLLPRIARIVADWTAPLM